MPRRQGAPDLRRHRRDPGHPHREGAPARVAIVVAGGDAVDPGIAARLPTADLVVAADSGIVEAERLGLRVDLLVGDLDSAPAGATAAAVERHPADKDKTDLELAMDAAVARGATHLAVVAGLGGRVDHAVANVLLLASDAFAQVTVEAYVGAATIHVVRSGTPRDLAGERGELVTLMAVGGVARGVTTEGLAWALADDDLVPGSTRGVSNVFLGDRARVAVAEGVLLAIVAGELAAPEGHSQV